MTQTALSPADATDAKKPTETVAGSASDANADDESDSDAKTGDTTIAERNAGDKPDDKTQTADDAGRPDWKWEPFVPPDDMVLQDVKLPAQSHSDLLQLRPAGERSFSHTTTTRTHSFTESNDKTRGQGQRETEAFTTLTISQQWLSENDWNVTQSLTRGIAAGAAVFDSLPWDICPFVALPVAAGN